jgi:hypothetical protein
VQLLKAFYVLQSMKALTLLFFILFSGIGRAQDVSDIEAQISNLQETLGGASSQDARLQASSEIKDLLHRAMEVEGFYDYPFTSLSSVSTLKSPDGRFRFFNWSVPMDDGSHKYECLVLESSGKIIEFKDEIDLKPGEYDETLDPEEWYGAIYYYIHPVSQGKQDYYVLLGWDGASELTSKKVIDVLELSKKGEVSLGKKVFQFDDDLVSRRVFEYSNEVIMTLKYMDPKDALVFDDLQPTEPGLEGEYAFYGPSESHDAYQLNKKGLWDLIEGFDMSRPESEDTGLPFNFPQRPDLDKIKR